MVWHQLSIAAQYSNIRVYKYLHVLINIAFGFQKGKNAHESISENLLFGLLGKITQNCNFSEIKIIWKIRFLDSKFNELETLNI